MNLEKKCLKKQGYNIWRSKVCHCEVDRAGSTQEDEILKYALFYDSELRRILDTQWLITSNKAVYWSLIIWRANVYGVNIWIEMQRLVVPKIHHSFHFDLDALNLS